MSIYHLRCSCLLCHKDTTVQSLTEHIKKCSTKTYCAICGNIKPTANLFCSKSCAAIHNNSHRSTESRLKQTQTVLRTTSQKNYHTRCKVSFCVVCASTIRNKWIKTCSPMCFSKHVSNIKRASTFNPQFNRCRHKKSYLESSFAAWLDLHHIVYDCEFKIYNHNTHRWYFVDFIFHELKLIIELDGTQHKYTIEADNIRDNYLRSIGYQVIRITHKEYQTKSKLALVQAVLGIS